MKKLIAILLSLTFVLSVSVFAATITPGTSDSKTVTATYSAADTTVYSVDIIWGSMNFVYAEESEGTWLPDSHTYTNPVKAGWQYPIDPDTGLAANEVKIVNHSNTHIGYAVTFEPSTHTTNKGLKYSLKNSEDTITSAVGTSFNNAYYKIASLTLDGDSPGGTFEVGTLTVMINK